VAESTSRRELPDFWLVAPRREEHDASAVLGDGRQAGLFVGAIAVDNDDTGSETRNHGRGVVRRRREHRLESGDISKRPDEGACHRITGDDERGWLELP
jgi:hypothetical protein